MTNYLDEKKYDLDIRVLMLGKALYANTSYFQNLCSDQEKMNAWVVLGNFDILYTQVLSGDSKNILETVWNHSTEAFTSVNNEIQFYPLYIFCETNDSFSEKNMIEEFWTRKSAFFCATLLHGVSEEPPFLRNGQTPLDRLEETIKNSCESFPGLFLCYHTMGLSDLVVLWKSDSIVSIVAQLETLYGNVSIGDMTTICGVNCLTVMHMLDAPVVKNEEIPFVNVRQTIYDARASEVQNNCFFITGQDNVNSFSTKFPTRELVNYLEKCIAHNLAQPVAAREIATQLGVPFNGMQKANCSNNKKLIDRCQEILETYKRICIMAAGHNSSELHQNRHAWLRPVGELVRALTYMSEHHALDSFCYVLLDSVEIFFRKICDARQILFEPYNENLHEANRCNAPRFEACMESLQKFVRGWINLTDQVLRVDGQLVHTGYNPVLCDIPAKLLEFYVAFTSKCSNVMQKSEKQYQFVMFMVPKLCRRIKVHKIFNEKAPCDRLLYVDVPIRSLFQPRRILCELSHEVSHFSGEVGRCRSVRYKCYVMSCSRLFGYQLGFMDNGLTEMIALKFDEEFATQKSAQWEYMTDMKRYIKISAAKLAGNISEMSKLKNKYLASQHFFNEEQRSSKINELNEALRALTVKFKLDEYNDNIIALAYFYEECYADLSMILLLKISFKEYYELSLEELVSIRSEGAYANLVQRLAFLKLTLEKNGRLWAVDSVASGPKLVMDICRYCELFKQDQQSELGCSLYFPFSAIEYVLNYLDACYDAIQTLEQAKDVMDSRNYLCRIFNLVARNGEINSSEFHQMVYEYRDNLLNKQYEY